MRARAYLALLAVACTASAWAQVFTDEDRVKIRDTWNAVEFSIGDPSSAATKGRWQVRLTAEGSTWLWDYNKARGAGKSANLQVAPPQNAEQRTWNDWIDKKVEYDRAVAAEKAKILNELRAEDDKLTREDESRFIERILKLKDPGVPPQGLMDLVGDAPLMADAVRPRAHTIKFTGEEPITFSDQPNVSSKFAYLRTPHGVMSGGIAINDYDPKALADLRDASGLDDTAWRVITTVSGLEGGFDSINTYDTGFISVGLIQFTTGSTGKGSLARVLLMMKENDPQAFEQDFRRYGIDVDYEGQLVVLSTDGEELNGTGAVNEVLDDPSLAAVFVRAGRRSTAFKVAQLHCAAASYYPADDTITVSLNGKKATVRVGDVVRSEAGLATLMDRKVHTGNLGPLADVLNKCAASAGSIDPDKLASLEGTIVKSMKHRRDFTQVVGLTQPGTVASRVSPLTSRAGNRNGRKKKP
jgi:hypothetical protein